MRNTTTGLDNQGSQSLSGDITTDGTLSSGIQGFNTVTGGNLTDLTATNVVNFLFGDCLTLGGTAKGVHNTVVGGSSGPGVTGPVVNIECGSAYTLQDHAMSAWNTVVGGNSNGEGYVVNIEFGGAQNLLDFAMSSNNTVVGGNALAGHVQNVLLGSGQANGTNAKGGFNTLVAGTASGTGSVDNLMIGDVLGGNSMGKDLFVFADSATAHVGLVNAVVGFSTALHDKLQISNWAGLNSAADIEVSQSGGATQITVHGNTLDQVTLVGFSGALHITQDGTHSFILG